MSKQPQKHDPKAGSASIPAFARLDQELRELGLERPSIPACGAQLPPLSSRHGAESNNPSPSLTDTIADLPTRPAESPPSSEQGAFSYDDLDPAVASALKEAADRIRSKLRMTALTPIEIGGHLRTAKESLGHGHFSPWIKAEFGWSERTAQRYMRLSEAFGAKPDTVSDLPIAVLHRLAAASPEVREKILGDLEGGESLKPSEILKLLRPKLPKANDEDPNGTRSASKSEPPTPEATPASGNLASEDYGSLASLEAAQRAACVIQERARSVLVEIGDLLRTADPHQLVQALLSYLANQNPDPAQALGSPVTDGQNHSQSQARSPQSIGSDDAAERAPTRPDVSDTTSDDIAPEIRTLNTAAVALAPEPRTATGGVMPSIPPELDRRQTDSGGWAANTGASKPESRPDQQNA